MNKLFTAVFTALLTVAAGSPLCGFAAEKPEPSARASILISADTGETVFAENANEKLPMASTTKIMTVLLCLESGGLFDEFTVDSDAIKVEGSSMGLVEGDTVTKYALCCGMLLPSGNDAANAAAVKIAGSAENFAELMNQRAEKLGLSQTFFVTPSGLEGDGHGSSARDMAFLAREALKNDTFREICSSETIQTEFGNPPYKRWLKNTNKLLSLYDGVYGVKTGFTDEAGRCLVSACERDGKDLICVTLNAPDDWNDHISMYDYGFEAVSRLDLKIPEGFEMCAVGGETNSLSLTAECSDITVTTLSAKNDDFSFELAASPFVYAPVEKGDEAAQLKIMCRGKEIRRIPMFAAENIGAVRSGNCENKSFIKKILSELKGLIP